MRLLATLLVLSLPFASIAQAPKDNPPQGTRLVWLGHAAFLLQTPGGANLLIDPWLQNPNAPKDFQMPAAIDAVLVSHGHADHVGQAKDLMQKSGTRLLAVNELARLLGSKEMGGNVGGSFTVKDATVHFVQAVHASSYDASPQATGQYAGNPIGFVIEIRNGPTLYHAGDTGLFGDMELIARRWKPQMALLPIGGYFTMGPQEAAIASRLLGVRTIVPMHYGTFPQLTGTPAELEAALKASKSPAKMKVMEPGRTLSL